MTLDLDHQQQQAAPPTKGSAAEEISVKLEFGQVSLALIHSAASFQLTTIQIPRGGLHLLFNSQPKHTISLPKRVNQDQDKPGDEKPVSVKYLIKWMKDNLLSERVEMFGDGDGVRPGILVLINDTDWELEGELDYQLQQGDEVVFISTLHGG